MKDQQMLDALIALCEGRSRGERLEVAVDVLLDAYDGLKEKTYLAKELEMARDEAQGMKPSVARKLNEKIRALEAELETLRTNKKVSDLEKKVKFLEQELKQSYTTKNFTLKSGLLELEKQYRAHMNVDPAMAAFWADVTVLLDEKKDKDSQQQFRGPPALPAINTPSAAAANAAPAGDPTSSNDGSSNEAAQQSLAAAAAAAAVVDGGSLAIGTAPAGSTSPDDQPSTPGVQTHVETFNSIISEEAAGAATQLCNDPGSSSSSAAPHAEMVIRQGGSFRIVKSQQHLAGDTAAAVAAVAGSSVVQDSLQPVRVLADGYNSRCKDVTFQALPAALSSYGADSTSSTHHHQQQQQAAIDTYALESSKQDICSSVDDLKQVFEQLQAQNGTINGSTMQQQMQQLVAHTQQLSTSSSSEQQQQQQTAQELLVNVQQLRSALEQQASSSDSDTAAVTAAQGQLSTLEVKLQRLQHIQQQAQREADSQQLLLQVFGEFLKQLEQQGVIAHDATTSTAAAAAAAGDLDQIQQPMLLQLLQGFLQVNQHIPHLVASHLQPTAAAAVSNGSSTSRDHINGSSMVMKVDAAVDAITADEARDSSQLLSPSTHASTQSDVVCSAHVHTQSDAVDTTHVQTQHDMSSTHAETQSDVVSSTNAAVQSDAVDSAHAETQYEAVSSNHAETQSAALSSAHAETQVDTVSCVNAEAQSDAVDSAHAETQYAVSSSNAGTQYDASHAPLPEISTQTDHPESQTDVMIQSDPLPSPSNHVSTQTPVAQEALRVARAVITQQATVAPSINTVGAESSHATQAATPAATAASGNVVLQAPSVQGPATQAAADVAAAADEDATAHPGKVSLTSPAAAAAATIKYMDPPPLEQDVRAPSPAAAAADQNASDTAAPSPSLIVRESSASQHQLQQSGSGVIYAASGSELAVGKVAVGQQLDVLHHLQRRSNGSAAALVDGDDDGDAGSDHVTRVLDVDVDQLQDMQAVAKELSQLRADNMELAASLQVTKSLVDHLNNNMKAAIDKADDAEAETAHIRNQLEDATTSLQQLQSEHAELTKLLIDAKVEIAEKKGELLKLVRNMRRAVEDPSNTAGMVKKLQELLAELPSSEGGFGEAEGRKSSDLQT